MSLHLHGTEESVTYGSVGIWGPCSAPWQANGPWAQSGVIRTAQSISVPIPSLPQLSHVESDHHWRTTSPQPQPLVANYWCRNQITITWYWKPRVLLVYLTVYWQNHFPKKVMGLFIIKLSHNKNAQCEREGVICSDSARSARGTWWGALGKEPSPRWVCMHISVGYNIMGPGEKASLSFDLCRGSSMISHIRGPNPTFCHIVLFFLEIIVQHNFLPSIDTNNKI